MKITFFNTIALLLILTFPLMAETEGSSNSMQILIDKVRADKKLLIDINMDLTKEESQSFWPIYEDYQNELFLLRTRTKQLIEDYAGAYNNMDNETAKKLLDEYEAIEALKQELRKVYMPKFREALPDMKLVRYYQIENKINAALMYEIAARVPLIKGSE